MSVPSLFLHLVDGLESSPKGCGDGRTNNGIGNRKATEWRPLSWPWRSREGMNEAGDSPKLRAVFRVCIWNQRQRAKSRSTELRMGSHGMRTHLASLTIPPQLDRTDIRKPAVWKPPASATSSSLVAGISYFLNLYSSKSAAARRRMRVRAGNAVLFEK